MMTFGLRPQTGTIIVGGELSAEFVNSFGADSLNITDSNINQNTLRAENVGASADVIQTVLEAEACLTK